MNNLGKPELFMKVSLTYEYLILCLKETIIWHSMCNSLKKAEFTRKSKTVIYRFQCIELLLF